MLLLEKSFAVSVEINNPINFYADSRQYLKTCLQQEYEKRCYKGCYIVRIKKLLKISRCRLVTMNFSGNGVIDLEFLADVIIFSRWDIIIGVEIILKQTALVGEYIGDKHEEAIVMLSPNHMTSSLAVGQKIPVRVIKACHYPLQDRVSIIATLLTCDKAFRVYQVRGSLGHTEAHALLPWIEVIQTELELRKKLLGEHKDILWKFERLLYAFKNGNSTTIKMVELPTWKGGLSWEGPEPYSGNKDPLENIQSYENLAEIAYRVAIKKEKVDFTGYWFRPLNLYRSSPIAVRVGSNKKDIISANNLRPLRLDPLPLITDFLKNMCDFLVATRELATQYSSDSIYKAHESVWKAMRSAQK